MKAYKVTTPNSGTQYARSADKALEILNTDGWDFNCGLFSFFKSEDLVLSFNPRHTGILAYIKGLSEGDCLVQSPIEINAYLATQANIRESMLAEFDCLIEVISID